MIHYDQDIFICTSYRIIRSCAIPLHQKRTHHPQVMSPFKAKNSRSTHLLDGHCGCTLFSPAVNMVVSFDTDGRKKPVVDAVSLHLNGHHERLPVYGLSVIFFIETLEISAQIVNASLRNTSESSPNPPSENNPNCLARVLLLCDLQNVIQRKPCGTVVIQ